MQAPEVHRELGALDARLDLMEKEVAALRKDMRDVLDILNQTKGSWKTLVAIAGISSALGALAVKLLPFMFAFPK
jgi:hypothetical protein